MFTSIFPVFGEAVFGLVSTEFFQQGRPCCIFVDEIQVCDEGSRVLDGVFLFESGEKLFFLLKLKSGDLRLQFFLGHSKGRFLSRSLGAK